MANGSREAYDSALKSAVADLGAKGIEDAARKAGCAVREGEVLVPLLDRTFRVSNGGLEARDAVSGAPAAMIEHILMVHYLAAADGSDVSREETSFREIPGGAFYDSVFRAHSVVPLASRFRNDGAAFEKACLAIGAERLVRGGYAMRFLALPRVPVTCTYWPGEDEMPAGAGIVFSKSVSSYLPAEDVAVLGEYIAHRIIACAGKTGGEPASLYEYD